MFENKFLISCNCSLRFLRVEFVLMLSCMAFLFSCSTPSSNSTMMSQQNDSLKMELAIHPLPSDHHSLSHPNAARVLHLNWNASVDFSNMVINATAEYNIVNITDTNSIVFDTKGLLIHKVSVDGEEVSYELAPELPFLGQALSVPIKPRSNKVAITYSTSPTAEALLWVKGDKPFLFTQSQAILARTWIPCQDSPGIRFSYDATVTVNPGLIALMSAENPQEKNGTGIYTFKMDQPVPSYLLALAVGDVTFRKIGKNTGVYATPDMIDAAAAEFEDMQKMVDTAESLYGPYVWKRYDLLVLPPAFPFGGMENPRLTFATPTIIAGDKSLVSLVAHELAHSWSGNLVTNATWDDFWLNEGFTVYFEQRIMEAVFGKERSEMLAQLARQDLDASLESLEPADTRLKLHLIGRNPDDGMTDIAYNKGYFFLRLIEQTVGREKFDIFLREYFTSHAFQVMDTESFLSYLKEKLINEEEEKEIGIHQWVYEPGLPVNAPVVKSDRFNEVDRLRTQWEKDTKSVKIIPWKQWFYQERYRFLSRLSESVNANDLALLDNAFQIGKTGNNEVLFAWLQQAIKKNYTSAYPRLEEFLIHVGRRKFVEPLFDALISEGNVELAKNIYTKARPNYHSVTSGTIDELMKGK